MSLVCLFVYFFVLCIQAGLGDPASEGLQLFEKEDMKGESSEIYLDDIADLEEKSFHNRARSLVVEGDDPWIVFTEANYGGQFGIFKVGPHSSIPRFRNRIASARRIKNGLHNPKITLYNKFNYTGKRRVLTKPVSSLKAAGMNNKASSHQVESGAWVLYDKEYYRGAKMAALPGDMIPDYRETAMEGGGNWDNCVSSLKPISPYEN